MPAWPPTIAVASRRGSRPNAVAKTRLENRDEESSDGEAKGSPDQRKTPRAAVAKARRCRNPIQNGDGLDIPCQPRRNSSIISPWDIAVSESNKAS